MNIILNIDEYDDKCVNIMEPTKNVIIGNGHFSRCIYSNELLTLNSIYLQFKIINPTTEKLFNKYKTICDFHMNQSILQKLYDIEHNLLDKYGPHIGKIKYLFNKLNTSFIIYTENEPVDNIFCLKISGVWNTDDTCGIACKFLSISNKIL